MSDREDSSTQSSSDFSDSFPSTTTISTVAVQAGQSKIILAILRVSYSSNFNQIVWYQKDKVGILMYAF